MAGLRARMLRRGAYFRLKRFIENSFGPIETRGLNIRFGIGLGIDESGSE